MSPSARTIYVNADEIGRKKLFSPHSHSWPAAIMTVKMKYADHFNIVFEDLCKVCRLAYVLHIYTIYKNVLVYFINNVYYST